jgi:hypothetical protein
MREAFPTRNAYDTKCMQSKIQGYLYIMLNMTCQMQEMHKGKLYICYKGAPTHPTQEIKHTPCSPANEWKLLDLGVWWKYRLVGHVWVHGSKLSSLYLHFLSENGIPLLCAWFWNEALVWRPRFLISIINANDRISWVKLADIGQLGS